MGFVTTQWLTAKGWKGPERTGHVGFVVGIVARTGGGNFKLKALP